MARLFLKIFEGDLRGRNADIVGVCIKRQFRLASGTDALQLGLIRFGPYFMARPPRVPVMLPWECRVIYFLTVCVIPRRDALANDDAWRALCQTLKRLDKWNTHCVLMMPDHIHLLTAPSERELSVAAFLKWLKRWFNELYDFPRPCRWQPGGFDRLLRTSESIHDKWNYIRENPVRAGLVEHWKQWPYRQGFFDDEI